MFVAAENRPKIILVGSSHIKRLIDLIRRNGRTSLPLPLKCIALPGGRLEHISPLLRAFVSPTETGYLLFQIGGNDVGAFPETEWLRALEEGVAFAGARFPGLMPIWSDMFPRFAWRYKTPEACTAHRARLQRKARGLMYASGGLVFRHPKINGSMIGPDGVHLTEAGNRVFLQELEELFWGLARADMRD